MLWGTMTVLDYAVDGYAASEQALAAELLPMLAPGDLAVGDRHFAGANYYAKYLERGVEFLSRVHQRLKIGRLRRLVTYTPDDFVVEMHVGKKHRREDPSLPKSVKVRLIRIEGRVRGKFKSIWLATSLLDAERYPAAETVPERPGRNEPRMKRRETKHYEALRTTRAEWRQGHAAAYKEAPF